MEVQYRMRNWYGHMMRREEHAVGRMTMEMYGREEGLIYDGSIECVVISKRSDCQLGSVRPSYINTISSNFDSQKSGTKMKRILTDEDDVPYMVP